MLMHGEAFLILNEDPLEKGLSLFWGYNNLDD